MRVKVLYFAALRDLAGRAEETISLPAEIDTVGALARHLGAHVPGLAERLAHVRIAKNEVFARDDERLSDGDVIALVPPVAGG
jgi:molybdopterin converting factor subunit 1